VNGTRDGQIDQRQPKGCAEIPYSLAANTASLAYDHTNIFNRGLRGEPSEPHPRNHILEGTVNGWEFSGITQLQSGPADPTSTGANSNADLNAEYGANAKWAPTSNSTYLGTPSMPLLPVLTCDPRSNLKSGYFTSIRTASRRRKPRSRSATSYWPYIKGPAALQQRPFAVQELQDQGETEASVAF